MLIGQNFNNPNIAFQKNVSKELKKLGKKTMNTIKKATEVSPEIEKQTKAMEKYGSDLLHGRPTKRKRIILDS